MDIVGSVAALAQLLGQVIALCQQVAAARAAVHNAPKALADVKSQLQSLMGTVDDVWRQKSLHTPGIHNQLCVITAIANELNAILRAMRVRQSRSAFRQGWYALVMKQRDDAGLKDVLDRLNTAKHELSIRIHVVHVDMSEEMGEGIARIEEAVHSGEGKARLPGVCVEDNVAGDTALQRNEISMLDTSMAVAASSLKISNNKAWGNGRQDNIILIGSPLPTFPT